MSSQLQHLLSFEIPDTHQTLSAKDAALYALSIGFGQDPLNRKELAFVDPVDGMLTVPSMALVAAYPGFWLGLPQLGLDAAKIVHAEQELVIHRTLPTHGSFVSRTRIAGVFDRGVGKGSVLYSERDLFDESSQLATLRQTHFLLGNQFSDAAPHTRRQSEAEPLSGEGFHLITQLRPEQALLYRLNGDMNPLHIDPDVAQRGGYPKPILHGMCTFGVVMRALITEYCDYHPERIETMSMRFRAPVYPGEQLRVDIWPSGIFRVHAAERAFTLVGEGRLSPRSCAGAAAA